MNLEYAESILYKYLYSKWKKERKQALLNAISLSDFPPDDPIHVLARRLSKCGWQRATKRGTPLSGRYRCGLPFCPFCSGWINKVETRRFLRKLEGVSGGDADQSDISAVMINVCSKRRGESFEKEAKRFKAKLDYRVRSDLKGVMYFGHRELAEEENGNLRLHAHLMFYHPGISKQMLVDSLKKTFKPFDQLRVAVSAESLYEDKDIKRNVARIINYQVKGRKRFTKSEYERLGNLGWSFMDELVKFIRSWATMWSGGLRGIRMQRGFDDRGNPKLKPAMSSSEALMISTKTVEQSNEWHTRDIRSLMSLSSHRKIMPRSPFFRLEGADRGWVH
jgi:hypothetical protein